MADILNQIDAVLADVTSCQCGCGTPISERGPSLWFVNESHQARWMRLPKVLKSRSKKGSARPDLPALLALADVTPESFEIRRRSPEDRRAYLAEQRALHVEHGAPWAWLESFDALAAEVVEPRPSFTLADMEAASAAVRARQVVRGRVEPNGPVHPGPGTFRPLGQVYLRPGSEPLAHWPDPSVTFAVDVSADGSGAVAVRDSDGHDHLAEVSPPADAALEPHDCPVERILGVRCWVCDPEPDDRPWWRRMFGGTR